MTVCRIALVFLVLPMTTGFLLMPNVKPVAPPSKTCSFVATAPLLDNFPVEVTNERPVVLGKPKISQISSPEDFQKFLMEDDRLTMIRFYASWCKSCAKMGVHYKNIAREVGDQVITTTDGKEIVVRRGNVRIAEIEYGANEEFCKALGIKKLPTVQFYSRGSLVDGFPAGPKKVPILKAKLAHYMSLNSKALSFVSRMSEI